MLSNDDLLNTLSDLVSETEIQNIQWQIDLFHDDDYAKPLHSLSRHSETAVYPASVCKLFYLVAALHFEETGRLTLDKEDERALADMIQHSSNEATVYLLGRLTQTENGALLNEADLDRWWHQRQGVDRFFKTLNLKGYESCQLFHGTYEFSPYGRENQVRQFGRNLLSPLACNQLMIALLRSEILGEASLKKCWTLLNRDWERALPEQVLEESQVKSFMAEGVSSQTRIWSKAGWTSETRHDCAVFRKGTGTLVVTVMSRGKGLATNSQWLPRFGGFLSGQFFS